MATRLSAVVLWVYAFGVALLLPWGDSPGNEQSWMAALGEAARRHFVFGRDIVYTYGPLGYLAVNAALPATYAIKTLAAAIIAALFASALVARVLPEGTLWQKLAVAAGSVIAAGTVVQVTTIDILLFFILALALTHPSFAGKSPNRYFVVAVGLFSGVIGLVKFSYCAGSFVAGVAALAALADVAAVGLYVAAFFAASAGIYACATFAGQPWTVGLATSSYVHFIARSFKEASEYSAGMAADGSTRDLVLGLAVVAIVIAVAVRERASLGVSRVLAIVFLLGLIFKEGFVRQDQGHLAVFYCGSAVLGALVLVSSRLRYSAIAALLVTAFALFSAVRLLNSLGNGGVLARELPTSVALNLRDAFVTAVDWRNRAAAFQQGYRAALAPDALAPDAVAKLDRYPVDLVGSEVNVVFANGFDWKPEPVFQPRNAYAPALDALDRDSLNSSPLRRELFEFDPVDNRYPLGDEPFTYRAIVCGDALDPRIAQPAATASRGDEFLVLQPAAARCGTENTRSAGTVGWDESIAVNAPRGSIAFLNVKIGYSLLGLTVKTLYHVPAVNMTIGYADGSNETYRIVPAVALDGLLVDPAPKTLQSFQALLAGTPVDRATSVRFSTTAPWCFTNGVGYRVTTVSYAKP